MKIYVARHGQTEWNVQDKVCGRTDLPLTEEGILQAKKLAEETAALQIDVIIAPPMKRAMETAGYVAEKKGISFSVDERLIEQDYGIYEGVDRWDEGFLQNKRQFAFRYPGGESMMDVAYRTYSLIEEIKTRYRGKNVMLVCHGGVARVIRTYFMDMTNEAFFRYSPDNCKWVEYRL